MFDPALLGIFPSIPSWKNRCHCRGIAPSAVASLALVVRVSIPITRNAGMSARVMDVSLGHKPGRWSFVVGRSPNPVLQQSTQCSHLLGTLALRMCTSEYGRWPTTTDE